MTTSDGEKPRGWKGTHYEGAAAHQQHCCVSAGRRRRAGVVRSPAPAFERRLTFRAFARERFFLIQPVECCRSSSCIHSASAAFFALRVVQSHRVSTFSSCRSGPASRTRACGLWDCGDSIHSPTPTRERRSRRLRHTGARHTHNYIHTAYTHDKLTYTTLLRL